MKTSLVATTAALAVALSGCADSVWNKPGATQQDFAADSYSCEKDMRQSHFLDQGLVGTLVAAPEFEKRCMAAHGWAQEGHSSPTTAIGVNGNISPSASDPAVSLPTPMATQANQSVANSDGSGMQTFDKWQKSPDQSSEPTQR